MVLLAAVGISHGLDVFVLFFGFTSFVSGLVGICVVTNLTPVMARSNDPDKSLTFTLEGIKTGAFLTIVAWIGCFTYARFALAGGADALSYSLAFLLPLTVLFSVTAEYHVALFLSSDRQVPVIFGNILISLPLVVLMMAFDISLNVYAILLVLAFALRSVIFFVLLYKPPGARFSLRAALRSKPLVLDNARQVLSGSSAMLAYSLASLLALAVAHRLGEGAATLLGYALKIPLLILTSLWFALGARFFSRIVQDDGAGATHLMLRLTGLNIAVAAIVALFAGLTRWALHMHEAALDGVMLDFVRIISASLPLLPIIVFVPIIEMSQRTLVTWGNHDRVPLMASVILGFSCLGFSIALAYQSMLAIMLGLAGALMIGAMVSLKCMKSAAEHKANG